MNSLRLVLLGPPASGKGTQGRIMTQRWGLPVVSVGELLRKEIGTGSPVGVEAARYLNRGQLVPDQVAIATVDAWLERQQASAVVFDGFPRTVGQAEALVALLERRGTPLTAVLWLELAPELIAKRVSLRLTCADCGATFQRGREVSDETEPCPVCGGHLTVRGDDDPAALLERMKLYHERTEPVAEFYAGRGLLRRIDANGTPDEVFDRIGRAVSAPVAVEVEPV